MGKIQGTSDGGQGTCRFTGYRSGGIIIGRGMRNKRRSKWEAIRKREMIEKEKREARLQQVRDGYDAEWGGDNSDFGGDRFRD